MFLELLGPLFALALSASYPVVVEKNVEASMRDGVVLRADVYRPDAPGRFPALLKRTPYSKNADYEVVLARRLASQGFVVAVQDTRGRYTSGGISRPHDEGEDGVDSVLWLSALAYTDGKVGMYGGSYAATTQLTAASLRPEPLVALFPSASYASRYDMVYQGGAFYLLDGLRWNLGQAADVRRRRTSPEADRDGPIGLTGEEDELMREHWVWHLPLKGVNMSSLREDAPGYFEMLEHPSYDAFWQRFDISRRHDQFTTPALHLTGWYDTLLVGTLKNFEGLSRSAATERARSGQRLIVGPWTHASPGLSSTRIGEVDFGAEAGLDSEALMVRWFRQWLKEEDTRILDEAPVKIFVMGENRWREEREWPLSRAVETSFYLRGAGALSPEAPGDEPSDRFLYDPWNPVPTPTREGYSRAPVDTSELQKRKDVLVYTSEPLDEALEVTGYLRLELVVTSSAPDTDFTGRLLDVAPDGSARTLGEGILRARYRKGFDRSELLVPGEPAELSIDLGATSNLFLPGHRIRLEISSSNFPRFDRNLNTGGALGEESTPRAAEQTIFHDGERPSRLVLPVLPREEETLEDAFTGRISRERISEFHRLLTARPHRSGTEGSRVVADRLASTLRDAGLEVTTHDYDAFLSAPRRVSLRMLAPEEQEISLREPPDPRDPDSFHPELEPGFIAYSGSGSVAGEIVAAGYGLPDDYRGVDARGKIVLVRYGKSHRAVKVATAQEQGAIGILIYSDPEDDGAGKGSVWPEGPFRAPFQLQRGNAKLSWFWHGDALTPGVAAKPGAPRLRPEEAPTLPRIPALPLSAAEAGKILEVLPRGARVRLEVEMDDGLVPIRNVVAKVRGSAEPERYVLLGTHHDAWTFGGIDPGSAAAVLMEVAYSVASLAREGKRPERSILFCFWDAEEYGLVGSTEFAEEMLGDLREKAVAYINTDMYNGDRFVAGGSPTLRDFVRELARDVPGIDPPRDLNALGSGADFVPFQDFVGLPTLSLELLGQSGWGFGTYHSNYDDRYFMERQVDPEFRKGALLARILGTAALRLASARVLPYRFSYYGKKLEDFVSEAERWGETPRKFDALKQLASEIRTKAESLETAIAEGRISSDARTLNDGLMRLEHSLIDETEPAAERWYRHVVYGWNIYSLYAGQPFPGLAAAITRGMEEDVSRELSRIERALERLSRGLENLAGK